MNRVLIKGATIVTMDDALGDPMGGDLLIEGDRIAALQPAIDAGDAEIVDGHGRIVIPGLVNAHMHTWQTALRGYAANWTLPEYFGKMHAGLATLFRADDIHIATEAVMIAGSWKKRNRQLLFANLAGKMAALAASGRRIIDDMNKIGRAA